MVCYILENRGYGWIYHWIVYILGGLRHISDEEKVRIFLDVDFPTINGKNYHLESLKLISDKYIFKAPSIDEPVKNFHGEPLIRPDHVHPDTYLFLRTLFLTRVSGISPIHSTRIYLTRKNCGTLNPANKGTNVRSVLNETDLYPLLHKHGFEILQFEDFSFEEKVNIFKNASIVISPNSGGLTFSLFADKENTHIVEILPSVIEHHDHYKNICSGVGVRYTRFSSLTTVGESPGLGRVWNMIVNVPEFSTFLETLNSDPH